MLAFGAPHALFASVAKASTGAVLLHLKDVFELEGEKRLGFEVVKIRVEEGKEWSLKVRWFCQGTPFKKVG